MRWVIRIVMFFVVLAVVLVGALMVLPADRIAGIAADRFSQATGRGLTIAGPVRPSIWPVLGARAENVTLANAEWSQAGPMMRADAVDIGVDLAALIRGEVVLRRFEARGPQILLERAADGRVNWDFGVGPNPDPAPAPATGGRALPPLSLDLAEISNASLRYVDRATGTDLTVDGLDLTLTLPSLAGPADLTARAQVNGQTVTVQGRIGTVAALLDGAVSALDARIETGGTTVSFEGRVGLTPPAAEGQVRLSGSGLGPLLSLAGPAAEPLPSSMRPVDADARITLAPAGSLHLRDGRLALGASRMTLALDLALDGPRPRLTGEVNAQALDLRGLGGGGGAASAAPSGWSRSAIDASALGLLDAEIALRSGPVQSDFATIDTARGTLVIDRARAVLSLAELRAFDGRATGELVANNRSGLSVGGNVVLESVALLPLLRQAAGFERLSGTGAAQLRFLGVGQSVDAIMRSLSGEGSLALGQGEIIGLDLAGMLRNLDMSYMGEGNRTIYDSLGGTFSIANGVLSNTDLRLSAPLVTVDGRGRVDLGARSVDYRVIPTALRDATTGQGLSVPLLITGPWDAPRFRLDLEGLAEQRLREETQRLEAAAQEELRRIEAEARARIEAEARRALGLPTAQAEGAAPGTPAPSLESEITRGLLQILGGGGN